YMGLSSSKFIVRMVNSRCSKKYFGLNNEVSYLL
ncbi:MAG: hypothetical protein ACI9CD_000001, partial [Candidatus Deianiraeaceae bacterium]